MPFEIFEHTADLGIRVEAAEEAALFEDAARGLFSVVVVNLEEVRPVLERTFVVAGTERDYLLFDWLSELLYAFDSEQLLFASFEVQLDADGLRATARGEPLDRARHELDHEVKAITYHELKVEATESGWRAEFIVDI